MEQGSQPWKFPQLLAKALFGFVERNFESAPFFKSFKVLQFSKKQLEVAFAEVLVETIGSLIKPGTLCLA